MSTDLEALARSAAADLHRRTEDVDTDAALGTLHRSAGTGRHRLRRLVPSGRTLAVAAAAVVLFVALALVVSTPGGDESERLGTETTQPVDPTSYGPLLGTLHGVEASGLTAKVYGPAMLEDGSEVAVSITGGRPGQAYSIHQCAVGDPDFHPAANCISADGPTLGADGAGVAAIGTWSVFDGNVFWFRNDCRLVACELQIEPLIEDDQPDDGLPGTRFAVSPMLSEALTGSPWIPIAFAADAGSPPLPEITATYLSRTDEGTRVRLDGSHLQPGQNSVIVDGFQEPRTGSLTHLAGTVQAGIDEVDVADDGTFSVEVVLPDTITAEIGPANDGDVVEQPEVVTCHAAPAYCTVQVVQLESRHAGDPAPTRTPLTAQPVRYPEAN